MKYKFIGNAYLLGIKLNTEQIIIEQEKDNISIEKAVQNIIFTVKGYFKTYHNCLDLVERRSFVILDGDFYYNDIKYDIFELQIPNTIEKMAYKSNDNNYTFFPEPHKIEQLYFMKVIKADSFTIDEFKQAFMTNHNLALFFNDKMVPYTIYHLDKQYKVMKNENYPNKWFNYDKEHKYYTMFDNILQVKPI